MSRSTHCTIFHCTLLSLARFFWNFKQKDLGTAAALCMFLAMRMVIEKFLLIISQSKRETMAKQQEAHYTRIVRHTVQTNRRSVTDQKGTLITSLVNTVSNGGGNFVIPKQHQINQNAQDSTAVRSHGNTHNLTATRRS